MTLLQEEKYKSKLIENREYISKLVIKINELSIDDQKKIIKYYNRFYVKYYTHIYPDLSFDEAISLIESNGLDNIIIFANYINKHLYNMADILSIFLSEEIILEKTDSFPLSIKREKMFNFIHKIHNVYKIETIIMDHFTIFLKNILCPNVNYQTENKELLDIINRKDYTKFILLFDKLSTNEIDAMLEILDILIINYNNNKEYSDL